MSKRIRYVKSHRPNELRSAKHFQGGRGGFYQVRIDTEAMTYKIVNIKSESVIRSSEKDGAKPPKNMYTVYEQVRRALKSLGVVFEHEFRNLGDKDD